METEAIGGLREFLTAPMTVLQLKQLYPSNPSEVREFVRRLAGGRGLASPHREQWMIGLYCPTIKGKTRIRWR